MGLSTYTDKWKKIPLAVRRFILRALAILVSWKILYLVFLLPNRVLDKPLSHSVASSCTWLLNTFTHSSNYSEKSQWGMVPSGDGMVNMPLENVYFHQSNVVSIEDGCNGLELIVLYAGFIICMPATWRRKLVFIISGSILIYVVNVLRCAGVAYIILYYPKQADFAHHYVFTFVIYGLIIALWLIFSRKITPVQDEAGR